MFYLNTFHPLALLNTTEIVFCLLNWGPSQPTSNISLLVWKPCTKTGLQWCWILLIQATIAILIFLRGIFSNSQVLNSFPQIAYSISWTWIPKKVFWIYVAQTSQGVGKLLRREVKRNENINMRSLGKACCGVALPPRRALSFFICDSVGFLTPKPPATNDHINIHIIWCFLCNMDRRWGSLNSPSRNEEPESDQRKQRDYGWMGEEINPLKILLTFLCASSRGMRDE